MKKSGLRFRQGGHRKQKDRWSNHRIRKALREAGLSTERIGRICPKKRYP